jgi:hypothetical protein
MSMTAWTMANVPTEKQVNMYVQFPPTSLPRLENYGRKMALQRRDQTRLGDSTADKTVDHR